MLNSGNAHKKLLPNIENCAVIRKVEPVLQQQQEHQCQEQILNENLPPSTSRNARKRVLWDSQDLMPLPLPPLLSPLPPLPSPLPPPPPPPPTPRIARKRSLHELKESQEQIPTVLTEILMPLTSRNLPRILNRRYSIAGDYFKFLEIGVRIGGNMSVEISIGDNRGKEISFFMPVWKELMRTKEFVTDLVAASSATVRLGEGKQTSDFITLCPVNFGGRNMLKLTDSFTSIYITEGTMYKLYKLEFCINAMYSNLTNISSSIAQRFIKFVEVVQKNVKTKNYAQAIMRDESFEQDSPIDCELLTFGLDSIVFEALQLNSNVSEMYE